MFSALTRCRLKRRWRRVCAPPTRCPVRDFTKWTSSFSRTSCNARILIARAFFRIEIVTINVRDYRIKILKIHLYWSFVNKCVLNYFEIIKELLRFISPWIWYVKVIRHISKCTRYMFIWKTEIRNFYFTNFFVARMIENFWLDPSNVLIF